MASKLDKATISLFEEPMPTVLHPNDMKPAPVATPDDARGLYGKFRVERVDGSSAPGRKHADCVYFVLDRTHDPFSTPALHAYADACEATNPALAADLRAGLPVATPDARDASLDRHKRAIAETLVVLDPANSMHPAPVQLVAARVLSARDAEIERLRARNAALEAERDAIQERFNATACTDCGGSGGYEADVDRGGDHDTVTVPCSGCGGSGSEIHRLARIASERADAKDKALDDVAARVGALIEKHRADLSASDATRYYGAALKDVLAAIDAARGVK